MERRTFLKAAGLGALGARTGCASAPPVTKAPGGLVTGAPSRLKVGTQQASPSDDMLRD